MTGFHSLLFREFIALCPFRDTRLKRTFNRITGQIICPIRQSRRQQSLRIFQVTLESSRKSFRFMKLYRRASSPKPGRPPIDFVSRTARSTASATASAAATPSELISARRSPAESAKTVSPSIIVFTG